MNLSENFRLSELFAGVALGAGIVAASGWSAVWIMLIASVAAMLAGLLTKQWIMTVAVALGLYVALPVWSDVLPGTDPGVPTVGDLIGTTTTTTTDPSVGGVEAESEPIEPADTTGPDAGGGEPSG